MKLGRGNRGSRNNKDGRSNGGRHCRWHGGRIIEDEGKIRDRRCRGLEDDSTCGSLQKLTGEKPDAGENGREPAVEDDETESFWGEDFKDRLIA
jgi:hypothetical protein